MQVRSFGDVDGIEIKEITLRNAAGATASVITWGAVLRDLVVPASSGPQRVVLGLNSIETIGPIRRISAQRPGRFANRIAGGPFHARRARLSRCPPNEKGRTTLHGGPQGLRQAGPWRLEHVEDSSVTLVLDSPDGDAGFPGAVTATCAYTLLEPGTLAVDLTATTDAPTIVNLAHHSYFNLDGSADILDHEVMLNAPSSRPWMPTSSRRARSALSRGRPTTSRRLAADPQRRRNAPTTQFRDRTRCRIRDRPRPCGDGSLAARTA